MEAAGLTRRDWLAFTLGTLAAVLAGCGPGESPDEQLIRAVRQKDLQEVERLLAAGANPNADKVPGFEGRPALFHAAIFGYTDIAQELIDKGASADYGAAEGLVTPLMVASLNGAASTVELLIRSGANVNARAGATTALTEATRRGYADVLSLLLAAGANPNVPMDDGSAPMCYAKSHGYTEAEQLLRAAGARGEC
jgi:ankyrin repeat protein